MTNPLPRITSSIPILSIAGFVAILYFGKALLMPIALSLLASFCAAPLVSRLERIGAHRIVAVILVLVALTGSALGIGWVAGNQLAEISQDTTGYRKNLSTKWRTLRAPLRTLGRAAGALDELERELTTPVASATRPPRVQVVEGKNPLETVLALASPLLGPLAILGAVTVLTLFLLIQREDLRDRVIRLAGPERITLMTHAIDDMTGRLSRYLGMLALLCGIHGLLVAIGLVLLGIPGALFLGIMAGSLRVVPYVGPWIAAMVTVLVALAAFPAWLPALLVFALFVALELLSNNVLEPWLYGTSAGLSPIAVVLSAFFWTWLWGLPGLFLATPITVCFVVLGRYVDGLAFVPILLGAEPALPIELRMYQRMLALDGIECRSVVRDLEDEVDVDALIRTCLARLSRDVRRGDVQQERAARVRALAVELGTDEHERRTATAAPAQNDIVATVAAERTGG